MKRFLLIPLVGILAALGLGSAAALGGATGLTTPNIAANSAVVSACDTDGISVSYTVVFDEFYQVTAVVLSGVNAACDGKKLYVTLTGTGTLPQEESVLPITLTAGVETVPFSPTVAVEDVTDIHVLIVD